MKKSKRLSLFLAVAVLLAMLIPVAAFAGSITITPPSSASVDDETFRAYQIFTVETESDTMAEAGGYVYTLNDEYADFEDDYSTLLGGGTLKDYILEMIDASGDLLPGKLPLLEELARCLWNWSEINNVSNVIEATGTSAGVTFTGLEAGYYIVAGSALFYNRTDDDVPVNPAGTFAALCTVLDKDEDLSVEFKADAPSITKEVLNHHNDEFEKWTDVSILDYVTFRLTSTIPDTSHYTHYIYDIIDTLSPGLTYGDIVSVYAKKDDSPPIELKASDGDYSYTVSPPDEDGYTKLTLTVESAVLKMLSEDDEYGYTTIEVIYTAQLNEDAVIEHEGNPNWVYLKYSNNPNWDWQGEEEEDTGETPPDDAWVYTYKLDVFKYTRTAGKDAPLEGVGFQLQKPDGEGNVTVASFKWKPIDGKIVYFFQGFIPLQTEPEEDADESEKDEYNEYLGATTLETDANGMIYVVGIDEGEYLLHESKPLPDYNPADDITITVYNKLLYDDEAGAGGDIGILIEYLNEHRGEDDTGTSLADTLEGDVIEVGLDPVRVYNGKGPRFPETGGLGTAIFYVVGVVLAAGIVTFVVIRRRKSILNDTSTNT